MLQNFKCSKARLYVATKGSKKLACDVREETGADLVCNAALFDKKLWKALCDIKADGQVLNNDKYEYRGIGWNSGSKFDGLHPEVATVFEKYENYLSCVMLIQDGQKLVLYGLTTDVKRSSGRTAIIGYTDGTVGVWCVKEGVANQTPYQLQETLLQLPNVSWALMLDGGGSSQLSQVGDDFVYSTRPCHTYMCFWFEKSVPQGQPITDGELHVYSKSKHGSLKLANNFTVSEFCCNDGSDPVFIHSLLPWTAQKVRDHFGKPVVINSSYRTPPYNSKVGGAPFSQHLYGKAMDISVRGVQPKEVYNFLEKLYADKPCGLGLYSTFVHLDCGRTVQTRWKG